MTEFEMGKKLSVMCTPFFLKSHQIYRFLTFSVMNGVGKVKMEWNKMLVFKILNFGGL